MEEVGSERVEMWSKDCEWIWSSFFSKRAESAERESTAEHNHIMTEFSTTQFTLFSYFTRLLFRSSLYRVWSLGTCNIHLLFHLHHTSAVSTTSKHPFSLLTPACNAQSGSARRPHPSSPSLCAGSRTAAGLPNSFRRWYRLI